MTHLKGVLGLLLLLSVCTCKSSSETERLHKEAFEKQEQVIKYISDIRQLLNADTSKTNEEVLMKIHELEENLFAIPGYALNLPGHEGHDHDHGGPELSANEILAVQEDLLEQVKKIKSDLE